MKEALPVAHGHFFELLGRLERARDEGQPPIGVLTTTPPKLTLRHDASLAFPTADVSTYVLEAGGTAAVTSAFLGLTGSVTPLVEHLLEGWAQDNDEGPLHALFDVWHHRLLGLLYRSVVKYSPAQSAQRDGNDAWSRRLAAFTPASDAIPLWRRLRMLPYASRRTQSAKDIVAMVQDLLAPHVPQHLIDLDTFTGGWQPLHAGQTMHLGHKQSRLGHDAIVGHNVCAPASAYTLRIGPLSAAAYAHVADAAVLAQLHTLVAWFTPQGVEGHMTLMRRPDAHAPWPAKGARLGTDTWLGRPTGNTMIRLSPHAHEEFYAL